MKLSRHSKEPAAEAEVLVADVESESAVAVRKGKPTPKRRDSQGVRGPVVAPKNRKEAYARQKQLNREQRAARPSGKPQSAAEQRAALRRGDDSALPRRDQGATRKLARDYVDSHRMFSNYLLILFPLMIVSYFSPRLYFVQLVVVAMFVGLLAEWFFVGRRLRAMAIARTGSAEGGALSIGFYAGSRAYLPRRWRLPKPRVELGDPI